MQTRMVTAGLCLLIMCLFVISAQAQESNVEYVSSTLWTGVCDVDVVDNYAYCAFKNGLVVLDVSDIENPVFVGRAYYQGGHGEEKQIRVSGDYAYVADGNSGLQIVDISNPANPEHLVNYKNDGTVYAVAVSGNYAFLANTISGLLVLDIIDPSNPRLETSLDYNVVGEVYNVFIDGNYAYACFLGENTGFHIIDISDPTDPEVEGTYETTYGESEIFVLGDFAYTGTMFESFFEVVNVADPENPSLAGICSLDNKPSDIYVDGDYAYLAEGDNGLTIIDISTPQSPTVEGRYDTPGRGRGVTVDGDYAYVANDVEGLYVIDVSTPQTPALTSVYDDLAYWIRNVQVAGDYAYVTDSIGLSIVDISDIYNPEVVSSIVTGGEARDVYVVDGYAYVSDGDEGLKVVDINDPDNPTIVGNFNTIGFANDIYVIDTLVYLADGSYGLKIFNVADPEDPDLLGSFNYNDRRFYGIYVNDGYAYMASLTYGMTIIDVSDPENPEFAGTYSASFSQNAEGLHGTGNDIVCLANGFEGLHIVDISNPSHPIALGSYATSYHSDYPVDVFVCGNYAFIGGMLDNNFEVIDISDPENPTLAGTYNTPGMAWSAYVYEDGGEYYILCPDQFSLMIMKFTPSVGIDDKQILPEECALSQSYPNPFNMSTVISYQLDQEVFVKLEVYDLLGRKVETLIDEKQTAGVHQVSWHPSDLTSGTYFYKLQVGNLIESKKMTLLK